VAVLGLNLSEIGIYVVRWIKGEAGPFMMIENWGEEDLFHEDFLAVGRAKNFSKRSKYASSHGDKSNW